MREKFTCRDCERISQPPAPFHPTPRGSAGPNLLAMIMFEKFGQHQPLNRQAERYAREGVDRSLSTLADQVGACAVALEPIHALIKADVMAAERRHGDDTTVPLLAQPFWIGGARRPPGCGPMCAMIVLFAALHLLPRGSTSPATGAKNIPTGTLPGGGASSRLTPMAVTTISTGKTASQGG